MTLHGQRFNELWDGRAYIKLHAAMDRNGNKLAKVFFLDGHIEYIKDPRLPLSSDKFYRSMSGLRKSR